MLKISVSENKLPDSGSGKERISAYILKLTILSIMFLLLTISTTYAASPFIKSIEVNGNKKISDTTIYAKIKSRVGDQFSKDILQKDIKRIYRIGYFDDVQVDINAFEGGVQLIFILTEKPTIISLDFEGNDEFSDDEIREHVTITPGAISNLSLITDNVRKIITFYQSEGYWLAKAVPVIREISEDAVALTFQIEEGEEVALEEIIIEGNSGLSEKKIKKVMETEEQGFFSFFTNSGVYSEEQIMFDLNNIRDLYQNNGFIFASVSEPSIILGPKKRKLYLTIAISEGDQYRVGDLKINGNTLFPDTELYEKLKTTSGNIFDRSLLTKDIDRLLDLFMEKGYARANINPLFDINQEEKTTNITFAITQGALFRIGKIRVEGNTKTRDKVIRREMRLDEGDIFNRKLITRSLQRINNLNYFEKVKVSPDMRAEEQLMDINIDVEEKLTGMISLGGGYSSVDKFMVMGEITQTNLFGKGLYLKFKADFSSRRNNYTISLRDPWFMDKPLSASISVYKESVEYLDYDKAATGGAIGFGKDLSEYVHGNITYTFENVTIKNVDATASQSVQDQIGQKITSSITPSIWRDTRDNYLDPTTGSRYTIYLKVAGLGGDNYFYKTLVSSSWFIPVKWDTTLHARGRIGYATGYADKNLPLYERFYVGGMSTLRGLGFGEGGPRNTAGEKIGGNKELIFNVEYIVPIAKEIKLKGLVFVDYGSAFDDTENITIDKMRYTVGFGIRWISPFGPIRLEWGFNLDPKLYEGDDKIEFSMGGLF